MICDSSLSVRRITYLVKSYTATSFGNLPLLEDIGRYALRLFGVVGIVVGVVAVLEGQI